MGQPFGYLNKGKSVIWTNIWSITYTTTIIYKEKVGICTKTKAIEIK